MGSRGMGGAGGLWKAGGRGGSPAGQPGGEVAGFETVFKKQAVEALVVEPAPRILTGRTVAVARQVEAVDSWEHGPGGAGKRMGSEGTRDLGVRRVF